MGNKVIEICNEPISNDMHTEANTLPSMLGVSEMSTSAHGMGRPTQTESEGAARYPSKDRIATHWMVSAE